MKESVKLNRISLTYQTPETEIKALENVSFTVHEGEFVSVIGPSGCGKTSVLSIIAGLIKPSSGELIFGGNSKTSDSAIGYMLQKDELFPWRTIEGNAYLPLEIKRDKDEKHRKIVEKLLKKYNLWEFRKSYPHELSGGMRQRAALIRTLAGSPGVLRSRLSDEISGMRRRLRYNQKRTKNGYSRNSRHIGSDCDFG